MQLNKDNSILEKMKIIVVKLDKIFILIPYTISKIEIRMRSILINNKNVMDGISHFMNFYLLNQQYQASLMSSYQSYLKMLEEIEYEKKFLNQNKNGKIKKNLFILGHRNH